MANKKLIIAANWKMHKTTGETVDFCKQLLDWQAEYEPVEVLVCPPFTALPAASSVLRDSKIKLGAQNLHWEKEGAFTGEISALMLADLGVEYVIIGHSERRHLFGEDDAAIHKKILAALENSLKPILCVGETGEERKRGETEAVIIRQLQGALSGIDPEKIGDLVVAYEPVWAIGTGLAASGEDAYKAAELIRQQVEKQLGAGTAARLRVQYGGSVKAANIIEFVSRPPVYGALVGGASLQVDSFHALIMAAREATAG